MKAYSLTELSRCIEENVTYIAYQVYYFGMPVFKVVKTTGTTNDLVKDLRKVAK